MRNEETGAWRTGSLLRDVSTYQLMLSATPINLGSDDLFNVLRLLDPDHFEYPEDFRNVVLANRSEEHTSELQSLMRISYAVFCLKKKHHNITHKNYIHSCEYLLQSLV